MPELPEVETTCNGIRNAITGKKIIGILVRNHKLRWPISPTIETDIKEQYITKVTRRAKYILMHLEKGTLILHLGMSGRLHIVHSDSTIKKHDHVDIILYDNTCIRYNDARRFGSIHWTIDPPDKHLLIKNLGVEPLHQDFNATYLLRACKNKKTSIKQLLMNQYIVVGIGNIYACETLYLAQVDPQKIAKTMTVPEIEKIIYFSKIILENAIKAGGTTLKDFRKIDGKPGYFQNTLNVYGRVNAPCHSCGTNIQKITQGQRSTFFCHICQN